MNQEIYHRAAELFLELSAMDGVDREAWLESKTDNPEVRQLVLELCVEDERYDAAARKQQTAAGLDATVTKDSPDESTLTGGESAQLEDFGDYVDLMEIGRGGLGVIYRAHQLSLNRTVAIKMIRASADASPAQRLRFCLEAETAAKLEHPNIVPIYEIGSHLECPFFAMKLIEGPNLSKWLREGGHSIEAKVEILIAVARAIQHAHENGVLHRDLKPANILIDAQDQPHVTDFGLAKQCEVEAGLTVTGQILGTPSYMPPEQASADNKQVTMAADVYGLGAVLYECLTKEPPFGGPNVYAIMRSVVELEARPANSLNPELDRDLNTICMKCLEKEPSKRYSSAEEFALDLERWKEGRPISARPVGIVEGVTKWIRRKPAAAGLLASLLALILVPTALTIALQARFNRGRRADRVTELVEIVRTGDTLRVVSVIEDLEPMRDLADGLLREQMDAADDGSSEKLNLALALLPSEPSVGNYLAEQLERLGRDEFAVVANALYRNVHESVWWNLLQHSEEPTVRSRIVTRWSELGVGLQPVIERLSVERRVDVRRALIYLVATQNPKGITSSERRSVGASLRDAYLKDPDPGIHAACQLALSHLGIELPTIEAEMETPDVQDLDSQIASLQSRKRSVEETPDTDRQAWEGTLAAREVLEVGGDRVRYQFDDSESRLKNSATDGVAKSSGPGTLQWAPALVGKGVNLTGDATIRCETDFRPDFDQPFSYGCWLKRMVRDGVEEDEYGTVMSRLKPGGGGGFDLWMNNGSLSGHLSSKDGFRGGMVKVAGRDRLPTDRWLHVFVTIDGSGEAAGMKLYVNGRRVESVVLEPRVSYSIRADADFFIGQRAGDLSQESTYPFRGLVDDVRMFDRELSPEEIDAMYWQTVTQVASVAAEDRNEDQSEFLADLRINQRIAEIDTRIAELKRRRSQIIWREGIRWYQSREGLEFSVIYQPAHSDGKNFDYTFAIGMTPVTVKQFLTFRPTASFERSRMDSEDGPMNSVNRHDAAAYCNWLSERDGLPESEWCYELSPVDAGDTESTDESSRVQAQLRKDYRDRLGYRLPILEEWQYACRACSTTPHHFGNDHSLFSSFGWDNGNSNGRIAPVARKLPNDFGLFDVHGGVWEWCVNGERNDARLTGGTTLHNDASTLVWDLSISRNEWIREEDAGFRVVRRMQ
ncbi:MAG: protein kinase [Planctomycetota bacterium]